MGFSVPLPFFFFGRRLKRYAFMPLACLRSHGEQNRLFRKVVQYLQKSSSDAVMSHAPVAFVSFSVH